MRLEWNFVASSVTITYTHRSIFDHQMHAVLAVMTLATLKIKKSTKESLLTRSMLSVFDRTHLLIFLLDFEAGHIIASQFFHRFFRR